MLPKKPQLGEADEEIETDGIDLNIQAEDDDKETQSDEGLITGKRVNH